jgi:acyl-coenzyme A thioesterase PaaI-like protein
MTGRGRPSPRAIRALPARVKASFARQAFMGHLGVELAHVAPGEVDLEVPFHEG